MWKFLSGLEKVIYRMKKLGFRLQRFTLESEVVAALTVQGGLVKNKMKGGSLYQTKPSRPPPLTCFFSIETPLFRQATFYLAELSRQIPFSFIINDNILKKNRRGYSKSQ